MYLLCYELCVRLNIPDKLHQVTANANWFQAGSKSAIEIEIESGEVCLP